MTRLKKSWTLYLDTKTNSKAIKKHIKKTVSARPTENRKERKNRISTNCGNTLDLMPITIPNKCKSGKGTHTIRSRRASAQGVTDTKAMQPIMP